MGSSAEPDSPPSCAAAADIQHLDGRRTRSELIGSSRQANASRSISATKGACTFCCSAQFFPLLFFFFFLPEGATLLMKNSDKRTRKKKKSVTTFPRQLDTMVVTPRDSVSHKFGLLLGWCAFFPPPFVRWASNAGDEAPSRRSSDSRSSS